MSGERASIRGPRGPSRGAGSRGDHSSRGGRGGSNNTGAVPGERPKKENILDLGKYMDRRITVKFGGGREGECGEACAEGWGVCSVR